MKNNIKCLKILQKIFFTKFFYKKSTKHQILFSSKQPLYLIIFSINLGNLITNLFIFYIA